MRMQAERRIERPPASVWAALCDLQLLRAALPGCRRLERGVDGGYAFEAEVGAGTAAATCHGTVQVEDVHPPYGCRLAGAGDVDPGGLARGSVVVRLMEDGATATRIAYTVEATLTGRPAGADGPEFDTAALALADVFFARLAAHLEAAAAPSVAEAATAADVPPPAPPEPPAPEPRGLRPLIWVPSLILLVLALLIVSSRP
ncbi:MAG: SRPBCC domain-containing protein [Rhodospirillales bacterium]